jgi:D-alanyl-D-alanine carboxypeptidase/D-alanyl-D-alanine-endopeptidase (penicillin-binding protein 4)
MSSGARVVLADHTSVPLIDAVRVVNKVSQNLHAELLLRAAAREKTGATDTEAALKFLQEFLKGIGIEEGDVILFDGSGLSRRNLVTPQAVVKLLAYAAQQPWAEVFRSTLPIAGEDGTLADRMKGTPAADRIWAKTGSLDHVRSLAGYATTVHGAQVIFSVFGNNHNLRGKAATSVVDAICAAMIEELGAAREEKKAP